MSLVVHYLELAASCLASLVVPLLHLLLEQEVSFPMPLELLATFSQASVPLLLVFSAVLPVLYQALSEASFLESTVLQAGFCLESEGLCPMSAALLVLFQQLSAELYRTLAQVLEVL